MMKRERLARYERLMFRLDSQRAHMDAIADGPKRHALGLRMAQTRRKVERIRGTLDMLALACRAMVEEQGLVPCDVPWCGCKATHAWVRTLAEIKASRIKRAKVVQQMEPESIRCETHVPDWRIEQYRPLTGVARVSVAA
jgi:hypothetical protein